MIQCKRICLFTNGFFLNRRRIAKLLIFALLLSIIPVQPHTYAEAADYEVVHLATCPDGGMVGTVGRVGCVTCGSSDGR